MLTWSAAALESDPSFPRTAGSPTHYDDAMLTYGVLLLIIGVVVWGIGRITANGTVLIIGQVVGAIGAILLLIGLILLFIPAGGIQINDALALLG